jgi:hypothetical protein
MLPTAILSHDNTSPRDLRGLLMDVVTELVDVIQEENAVLAEGLPAAVTATIDRKLELSDAYEELCAELADTQPGVLAADPDFAARLMDVVLALREATAENLVRLEAAVSASQRRVEAVMAAMRSTAGETGTYDARGGVPLNARLAAFGRDYHA